MNEWTNEQMNKWTNEQMNKKTWSIAVNTVSQSKHSKYTDAKNE